MPPDAARTFATEREELRGAPLSGEVVTAGDVVGDFTLPDATGRDVTLSHVLRNGPVVIVFYRGGWCPYCNIALRTYQADLLPELGRFDASLIAISPQRPDESLSTAEKAELSFPVLSDTGAHVARRLGIAFEPSADVLAAQRALGLDLREVNAAGTPDLPRPTVLVIDANRAVRFADTHLDYSRRTEVAEVLAALDGMSRPLTGP